MEGQNAWVTQGQASRDATAMTEMRERSPHQQPLSGLNKAYLESLLGQEVVITLGDASTRQGTVCDVDRQGTVALSKTFVIPRDAVKGVEVVGGGAMAQDALRRVGGSDPRSARSAEVFARERMAFRPFSAPSSSAPFGRGAFPPRADPAAEQSSGAFLNTIRART